MMSSLNIPPPGMIPPPAISDFLQAPRVEMKSMQDGGKSFSDVLTDVLNPPDLEVKFSSHAKSRVQSRGMDVDREDVVQLERAMDMAKEKGAHDSLVLIDGKAFIVNVDSRTVVTAMDNFEQRGGVFTNIDSTIVMS